MTSLKFTFLDYDYVQSTVGNCNAYADDHILSKAECEAAGAKLSLITPDISIESVNIADDPYGCYWKSDEQKLFFNVNGDPNDTDPLRVNICRDPRKWVR